MKATQILVEEHRVIEQVLDCLEAMAHECRERRSIRKQDAKDAVDFFRSFADRCHHGKEEAHLFRVMEARGYPHDEGPVAVMLHEHETGRSHLRSMDDAIDAADRGDADALEAFASHAEEYVGLLRQHIHKEDHCLFPMADEAFSPEDQEQLLESFRRVEAHDLGAGTHERYLLVAEALCRRYGVRVRENLASRKCGCSH
jgi:hemerythrin-like domain-containing protein